MDKESQVENMELPRYSIPPHWVLACIDEGPESLRECWEEHNNLNASRIKQLDRKSVAQIAAHLQTGGLAKEVAELIAENLPCQYLEFIEDHNRNPRNSKLSKEAEAIRKAATKLQQALCAASGFTLGSIQMRYLFLWLQENKNSELAQDGRKFADSDEGKRLLQASTFFLGGSEKGYGLLDDVRPSPEVILGLSELAQAAESLQRSIPEDKGGPVSGDHDSTGARARGILAERVRELLRYLHLPFGAHKGGAVSSLIRLICHAAGESETWADRYAAMTPRMERDRETQGHQSKSTSKVRPQGRTKKSHRG